MKFCPTHISIRSNCSIMLWSFTTTQTVIVLLTPCGCMQAYISWLQFLHSFWFNVYLFHTVTPVLFNKLAFLLLYLCHFVVWHLVMLKLGKEEGFLPKEIYFTHFTCLADILWLVWKMKWPGDKVCKKEIPISYPFRIRQSRYQFSEPIVLSSVLAS